MLSVLRICLVLSLIVVAGCRVAPLYTATDVSFASAATNTSPLTLNDYKKAIIRAGANRGWSFTEEGRGHLLGSLNVRNKHFAEVDVTFDATAFSLAYKSSRNLNYNAGENAIHPNYNNWVKNLQKDIQAEVIKLKAR